MGKNEINMENFIDDIKTNIEVLINKKTALNGNKQWTVAVKKALIDVADKYNLSVSCNIYNEEYGKNENMEWLYDAIIYSRNNEIFDEVYLVCESEWGNYSDIVWDFEKLLFARAKVRLMVYAVAEKSYDEYYEKLTNIIEKSNSCLKGDIFLFAIWKYAEPQEFKVVQYIKKGNT
jgi:hypothetical protein